MFLSLLSNGNIDEKTWEQTYATASAFWTGFQDRVTVLLNDGGLWKRSWMKMKIERQNSKRELLVDAVFFFPSPDSVSDQKHVHCNAI